MSTYEAINSMLTFGILLFSLLTYIESKNDKKK